MPNVSHVQVLNIAEWTLRGESDARIATAFGLDLSPERHSLVPP